MNISIHRIEKITVETPYTVERSGDKSSYGVSAIKIITDEGETSFSLFADNKEQLEIKNE